VPAARGSLTAAGDAVAEVARGRSMDITVEEAWQWSFLAARASRRQRYHDTFFHNAIRWLVRDSDLLEFIAEATHGQYLPASGTKLSELPHTGIPSASGSASARVTRSGTRSRCCSPCAPCSTPSGSCAAGGASSWHDRLALGIASTRPSASLPRVRIWETEPATGLEVLPTQPTCRGKSFETAGAEEFLG
jgi:hypothetical protein